MNEVESVKNLFRPIQPTIKRNDINISYIEFKPSKKLQHYIYCYWQLKSIKPMTNSYKYRVVSDGCIDIFFESKDTTKSFVMGFCRKYTEFELGNSFNYVGIRFLPSFFHLFFNINSKNLSNKFQELKTVKPKLASWLSSIKFTSDYTEQFDIKFESVLESSSLSDIDTRFYGALHEILKRKGNIDLEKEMIAGLSSRQLRRKFNKYIGTTPKAFANVVRFQHILNAKPSQQSLKENKIYYDVGFYDQAHFIKSFKTFYGVTPSKAFT